MGNAKGKAPRKKRPGRPKRDPNKVFRLRLNLWLIRGEDDDLIALFENASKEELAAVAKRAWRMGASGMQQVEQDDTAALLDTLFDDL